MKRILSIALGLLLLAAPAYATCSLWSGNTYTCLSSDTKPAATNGSRLYETDTRKEFLRTSGSWFETTSTNETYLSKADAERSSSGVISGGTFTVHGQPSNQLDIAATVGYVIDPAGSIGQRISCGVLTNVATIGDGINYIHLNTNCTSHVALTRQSDSDHLYLGYVYSGNGNTVIIEKWEVPERADNFNHRVTDWVTNAVGTLSDIGNTVEERISPNELELSISSGTIYSRLGTYTTSQTYTFTKMYKTADFGWVSDTSDANHVNVTQWNDTSQNYGSALSTMTAGYYKVDLLLRVVSGNVYYIYGQNQYGSEGEAAIAPLPEIPEEISHDSISLIKIIAPKNATSIYQYIHNLRPRLGMLSDIAIDSNLSQNVQHGISKHLRNLLSTGLLYGGDVTINTDDTKFDIAAGSGIVIDNYTNPYYPTITTVTWATQTGLSTSYLVSDTTTYVYVNASGALVLSPNWITASDRRDLIVLGWLDHSDGTGHILEARTEPFMNTDIQAQMNDFFESFGSFNIDGNVYSAASNNLTITRSAGNTWDNNANYYVTKKSPHIITTASETPASLTYYYRDGAGDWVNDTASVTNVDAEYWDDATGTLNTVSTGSFTIQYMTFYANFAMNDVQYGQAEYASMVEAEAAVYTAIAKNPYNAYDTPRAYLIVQQGTTDLSDTAKAKFIEIPRFGGGGGGGSGGTLDHSLMNNLSYALSGHTGFAESSHVHAAGDITSGTLDGDLLPVLSATKRGSVAATGTPSGKYYRDDDSWQTISAGGAPTTSKYLLQQADGSLPNAQAMGVLGTGLVKNTTSTGVQSIAASGTDYGPPTSGNATGLILSTTGTGAHTAYGGTSCTNQFPRSLNASGAATCAGIGVADFTANQGTTSQVLHGNAAGQPAWGVIAIGELPTITVAKGGSNLTTVAADQVYVGTAADTFTAKSLPSCSVAGTSKLLYDTTTHAFSCGTDQSGGAASGVMTMMNVKLDCGATGDGTTNDTTAIQTCITAAIAGHGGRGVDLYFPEGVYRTTTTLTVNGSNVRLIGAGVGSTVIYPDFTTGDIIQFGDGTNARAQLAFMHMQIFAPASHTSGVGINVQYVADMWISDFSMTNMFIGVQIGSSANPSLKVHVTNGTINATYATTGIGIYVLNGLGGDTYIDNIVMSNNPASKPGTGIMITQTGHTSIMRTNVTSCLIGIDVNPGANQDVNYLFIDHSLFDSGGTHGARFAPTNSLGRIRSVMAVNSWFAGSLVNYGVEIGGAASSTVNALSFIGCRFLNNYHHGIYISYSGATNISFTDCTISGNGQQSINTYDGINSVANVSGVQVVNNTIGAAGTGTNQQRYAINIAAGTSGEWQIIGNDCGLNGTVGTNGYINTGALTGYGNQIVLNNPQMSPGMASSRTTATAAINTTNTIISNPLRIKANSLSPGTVIRITAMGTCTSTAANISTFRVYFGPNGTTADTLILTTATTAAATTGTAIPFRAVWDITIRTVGSGTSATNYGSMTLLNNGVTGIISEARGQNVISGTAAGFNSTADGIISLAYQSAATTTTSTFQQVHVEIVKP